jgi:hypothetical protein
MYKKIWKCERRLGVSTWKEEFKTASYKLAVEWVNGAEKRRMVSY